MENTNEQNLDSINLKQLINEVNQLEQLQDDNEVHLNQLREENVQLKGIVNNTNNLETRLDRLENEVKTLCNNNKKNTYWYSKFLSICCCNPYEKISK